MISDLHISLFISSAFSINISPKIPSFHRLGFNKNIYILFYLVLFEMLNDALNEKYSDLKHRSFLILKIDESYSISRAKTSEFANGALTSTVC